MKINWYKVAVFAAAALAVFFLGKRCGGGGKEAGYPPAQGVVRVDTVPGAVQVVIDTHYVPKPYKVVVIRTPVRMKIDPWTGITGEVSGISQPITLDTSQFIKDCEAIVYYSDTLPIDHGTAVINDTVSQNRITGRSVKVSQQIPVIRETVTRYQPKRNIVYLGVSVQGGPQNYLFAAGADLSLKTKNDRVYSAGISLTRDNQVLYQGGVRFPIRLSGKIADRR